MRLITICAITVFAIAGTCLADPTLRAILRDPGMAEVSGITGDQVEEIGNLYESTERVIIDSRATLQIKHLELAGLERSDKPDMTQIRKLVDEMERARSSATVAKIERRIRMRQILTTDQMRKLRDVMRLRGERRRSLGRRHELRARPILREHPGPRGRPVRLGRQGGRSVGRRHELRARPILQEHPVRRGRPVRQGRPSI